MAKITIIFGVLLVILGLVSYLGTGSIHPTALIPTWFGLALGIGGFLAISPSEKRRKIMMHINVTIGLLGFLGAAVKAVTGYGSARSAGIDPDMKAIGAQIAMAIILLVYIKLCVDSFLAARRKRNEEE
jgi:hypothetical protein